MNTVPITNLKESEAWLKILNRIRNGTWAGRGLCKEIDTLRMENYISGTVYTNMIHRLRVSEYGLYRWEGSAYFWKPGEVHQRLEAVNRFMYESANEEQHPLTTGETKMATKIERRRIYHNVGPAGRSFSKLLVDFRELDVNLEIVCIAGESPNVSLNREQLADLIAQLTALKDKMPKDTPYIEGESFV